ncbi:MAG TPA: signal peptide peptidase SppA, partial [Rhodanobacteraceae bacterium]
GGESTSALIREARADPAVRAIVLRVDSPGGQAFAAEQIRREVVLAKKAGKPVIVSMGDMAASGGYWISMDATRIFAEPDTITGSIGIFGLYFTASHGLAKLGINTAGEGTTPLAGALDVRRPLSPALGAMLQSTVDAGYREFVGDVAKARHMTYAQVDAVAQGRVWSGAQALQRGLVDQLGGVQDAIAYAAKAAKLGHHYSVRYLQPRASFFQRLTLGMGNSASVHALAALGVHLPRTWLAAIPHLMPALQLLEDAQPGKPTEYAYCFCRLRP